jgi:hypothetical protein
MALIPEREANKGQLCVLIFCLSTRHFEGVAEDTALLSVAKTEHFEQEKYF